MLRIEKVLETNEQQSKKRTINGPSNEMPPSTTASNKTYQNHSNGFKDY
jgi:hypothetical protein